MLIGTGSCCCSIPDTIYSVSDRLFGTVHVSEYGALTGLPAKELYKYVPNITLLIDFRPIAVDINGDVYVSNDSVLIALTPTGIVRWSTPVGTPGTVNGSLIISGIAVSNDGYVYTCNHGLPGLPPKGGVATVTKFDVHTGALIWTYTGMISTVSRGICVDISGNIYVCGNVGGSNIFSLTSAGTFRWNAIFIGNGAGTFNSITSIAINLTQTELVATAHYTQISGSGPPTAPTAQTFDPATGTNTGTFDPETNLDCSAYSAAGNRFVGGVISTSGIYNTYGVWKNNTNYYKPPALGAPYGAVRAIAISPRDNSEVFLHITGGFPIQCPVLAWKQTIVNGPANFGGYALAHNLGLIGAFGPRP